MLDLKDPKVRQQIAFYGVFYLVVIILVLVGDLTKEITRPLTSLIFPINDKPVWYSLAITTCFYWAAILFVIAMNSGGQKK